MKSIMGVFAVLVSAQVSAAEIKISGSSAKAIYTELEARSHGVEKSEAESPLGSRIEQLSLYSLMTCGKKHGWIFTTYRCKVSSTQNEDLDSRNFVSLGGDELDDALAGLNREINRTSVSSFSGLSAKVVYRSVEKLTEDKSYYSNSGQTRWLKRDYVGVGIDEVYCQKINGVFGEKYRCVLPNVRASDTNAPTIVATGN